MRSLDGREYGPIDLDGLIRWAREGRLIATMQVEKDGTGVWQAASSYPELATAFTSSSSGAAPAGTGAAGTPVATGGAPASSAPTSELSSGLRRLKGTPSANLSVGEVFGKAWSLMSWEFLGYTLVVSIVTFAAGFVAPAAVIVGGPMQVGLSICALRTLDGEPVELKNVFDGFKRFIEAFLSGLLFAVASALGILCCLVGVFVPLIRLPYWTFALIDRPQSKGIESLQDSWAITEGRMMDIFLLVLTSIGVALVGTLLCGVGIFPAIALIHLASAVAYRQLVPKGAARAFDTPA
ncbi:MAG: DUF4339 domain-containing protein [Planctomycetes bacterium]|nr:DUF4339 domain-containing protein [Planctomycetota bacterium]